MRDVELAIIGAGPAGICAAIEAAKLNVSVSLIDENVKPGGQIYRQSSDAFIVTNKHKLSGNQAQGNQLIRELASNKAKIEFIEDSIVWGIFNDKIITYVKNGKNEELKSQKLIIAEGAYDRPMPFPGWTLPGVFTAGGTLRMVKTEMVLPGKKILLAGTGPLQLLLATQLAQAGAEVVAVVEAASSTNVLKNVPKFWGQWELIRDGLGFFIELKARRIPYLMSHAIVEARGISEVTEAVYAKVNKDGEPVLGTERKVEVDAICLGYGLIPSTRLSKLCGCEHKYETSLRAWVPLRNKNNMETSIPGVFVTGDGAGIGGASVAKEEGRLAAIEACRQLGYISAREAERSSLLICKRLKNLGRFESALNQIFSIQSGLYKRIPNDTLLCRCEEVTAGEVRKLIAEGKESIQEIKNLTRVGMGHCQGRMCEVTLAQMISIETKQTASELKYLTPRPPVKPVPLGVLTEEDTG